MSVGFEWNATKAGLNLRKHRISFDEATTVFDDPLARIFDDPDHSVHEARESLLGIRSTVVCCWYASTRKETK
jgi:uncharacterized DUF497 family protein